MSDIKFDLEIDSVKSKSQRGVNELRGLSSFFTIFTSTYQDEVKSFEQKLLLHENKYKVIDDSILSANLVNIYDCFRQCNNNIQSLMSKIDNELISPLEVFRNTQFKIYQENINELRNISTSYKENKDLLDNLKFKYYRASTITKKNEEKSKKKSIFSWESNTQNNIDDTIHTKMEAKYGEIWYKYEVEKFNKNIVNINQRYKKMQEKIQLADKSRIYFIKTSFDKYRKFMDEYINNIKDYITIIENYISDDICEKDQKNSLKIFSQYKNKNEERIKDEQFISFNEFASKGNKTDNEKDFKYELLPNNSKLSNINEKELDTFLKLVSEELLSEKEIEYEKLAKLIELFQNVKENSDIEKKFMDAILAKQKLSSIKFHNLKNLEHLANVLNFINLRENSIYKGKFELNFKIIFLAQKVFYQNKINNKKVYLSAVLSKNEFYRTNTFWRNIIELKLANKMEDHISRLKNYILPEEKNAGFFKKISGKLNNIAINIHKNSLLGQSKILPLLKGYNELEDTRVQVVDNMATQEMSTIIKDSIPSFYNFNLPSEKCLDLIAQLVEDYKIPSDIMNYYVAYANVSSHTIRQLLPHENKNYANKSQNTKNMQKSVKFLKILEKSIQFLDFKDYNNLLLCSKMINKKLKKKIYKHVLKQKNLDNKIRLYIWGNVLNIRKLKKEYNYQQILNSKNDEELKAEIKLDVGRTSVNDDNSDLHRQKISNILYGVALIDGESKYCQGMNFIVMLLYEIYGEEDAFYIFLSFFKSTEYPLIFEKDLQKLKAFFYVFNRIIQLFEPELASYFNMHGINTNIYLPPWLITLFTSSHQYLRGENDNTKILIRILDNYIVSGWKSMICVSCALLHSYEDELMNKKYEVMIEFLVNELQKSEFFSNKNLEKLEEYFAAGIIKKKLIKNIEAEFVQDQKFKELKNNM